MIIFIFLLHERKIKKKATNDLLSNKLYTPSIIKEWSESSLKGVETFINDESESTPNLANISAHAFPSRKVCEKVTF
jgi:hypothetical protein